MKDRFSLPYTSFCIAALLLLMTTSMLAQNIAPYVDKNGRFKVFDNGQIHDLERGEVSEVSVGKDYLVYRNEVGDVKEYAEGEVVYITSNNRVQHYAQSYLPKYRVYSYLDDSKRFMINLEEGDKELCPRPPRMQLTVGNTLAFVDDLGFLQVFDNGEKLVLEVYHPDQIAIFEGIVAYTDLDGRLKAYYEGEQIKISSEIIEHFEVIGRVIVYTLRNGKVKIFHSGKYYSG